MQNLKNELIQKIKNKVSEIIDDKNFLRDFIYPLWFEYVKYVELFFDSNEE